MNQYEKKIVNAARSVWEVMQREAKNRGFALTKEKPYGDGRVIINTVGAFIKGLNKERDWGLNENDVRLVRRYLKDTGNVVVLNKVEQYRFRIFIREEWNEELLIVEPRKTDRDYSREERLRPEEVGEDREPEPVKYICGECKAEFDSYHALNGHKASHSPISRKKRGEDNDLFVPITEGQAKVLLFLASQNGSLVADDGLVAVYIADGIGESTRYVTGTLGYVEDRGFITRVKRHPKRTHEVHLTEEGWDAARNINDHRMTVYVLEEYLAEVKQINTRKSNAYEKAAKGIGSPTERTAKAMRDLEEQNKVKVVRDEVGRARNIAWTGGDITPLADRFDLPGTQQEVAEVQETSQPESTPDWNGEASSLDDISDQSLLDLVGKRMAARHERVVDTKTITTLQQKLDLIQSLVEEVNQGKMTPLKALTEIQEAAEL